MLASLASFALKNQPNQPNQRSIFSYESSRSAICCGFRRPRGDYAAA